MKKKTKYIYIVTMVEICSDGDVFTSILHDETPGGALDQVKAYLETEANERDLNFQYDEKDLLGEIEHGNETSGPFIFSETSWDSDFRAATKRICV